MVNGKLLCLSLFFASASSKGPLRNNAKTIEDCLSRNKYKMSPRSKAGLLFFSKSTVNLLIIWTTSSLL